MLVAQHRTRYCRAYARVAYSSVMAKTTSSSSFLQRVSRYGRRVDLIASTGIRVATIETLWMVFTLLARSSVSSSSLNNSNGFIFYIQFNYNYSKNQIYLSTLQNYWKSSLPSRFLSANIIIFDTSPSVIFSPRQANIRFN